MASMPVKSVMKRRSGKIHRVVLRRRSTTYCLVLQQPYMWGGRRVCHFMPRWRIITG